MKKYIFTALALYSAIGLSAAPITPQEALSRLSSSDVPSTRSVPSQLKLRYTFMQEDGIASAYVFTPDGGQGFTILSADDMAVPVLGYSESGKFDKDNMPPALAWWLNGLSASVSSAVDNGNTRAAVKAYAPEDMTPIAPLVKTKWNQDAPYNNQTPEMNGRHTYTGCVATSFAQAMKYWEYPKRGKGSITYYDAGTRRVMNFTKDFDWDHMLDTYADVNYTQEEADAVSFLMKACGYSVEMTYGLTASGAISYLLAEAAVKYFQYDQGVYYTERVYYTLDEWSHMIYDNLKIGPVIYNGQAQAGGHSFICDGYDGNGYFHFNWGWGGMSDGYFVLDALNPASQGIGGADGGFNYYQGALLGLQPPVEGSEAPVARLLVKGNVQASLEGKNILFSAVGGDFYTGWGNASYRNATFSFGAIISSIDGSGEDMDVKGLFRHSDGSEVELYRFGPTNYIPSDAGGPVIQIPALADGKYKVTVAAQDISKENSPLLPMLCDNGCVNYCYLTVENGVNTVTSASPLSITYDDVYLTTPLYFGKNCRFAIEATNNTDLQLSQSYYPALYRDGKVQYAGDYLLLTVNPGETTKVESFTAFAATRDATITSLGTYQLALVNAANNELIGLFGEYELTSVSYMLNVTLNDFSISGAPQEDVTVGSRTFKNVYVINDANEIIVNLDYTVVQGYFDTLLRIVGGIYNPDDNKFVSMAEDVYSEHPFIGEGDTGELMLPIDTEDLETGKIYRLVAGYPDSSGATRSLGTIYFWLNSTGVDFITDDTDTEVAYFTLQGVRVYKPERGQILIQKIGNISKKIVF